MLVNQTFKIHACQEVLNQFGPMPFSSSLSALPNVPAVPPRSSSFPLARSFASQSLILSLRAAMPFGTLPISPFALAPFFAAMLPKLFASVGWCSGVLRSAQELLNDSTTEIARSNFSTWNCATRRSTRSC